MNTAGEAMTTGAARTEETDMAVVMITGSSSGLGLATALTFARRGDRVYATVRSLDRSHDLVDAAETEGLDVRLLELDVTKDESVQRATAHVLHAEGRVDLLVNNAGILHFGSVELLPDDLMRSIFETNVFGPVRLLRAVLPTMRSQRSGLVINISSIAGRIPSLPILWSYHASKHGLSVLSDALAMELRPLGIRVLCIEPDVIRTNLAANASRPADGDSPYRTLEDAVVAFFEGQIAAGPDPQLVADAILDAVARDDGRLHIPVGDAAEFFAGPFQSLTEAEMMSFIAQAIGNRAPAALDTAT